VVKGTPQVSTHLCMVFVQRAIRFAGQFEVEELYAPSLSPAELRPRGINLLSKRWRSFRGHLACYVFFWIVPAQNLRLISKTKFAEFSDQARCPPVDVVLLD
jgi:hypothetical protein